MPGMTVIESGWLVPEFGAGGVGACPLLIAVAGVRVLDLSDRAHPAASVRAGHAEQAKRHVQLRLALRVAAFNRR